MLQICLFGNLQISLNKKPWEFSPRPKTVPLLGYLLLYRDNPIPRDTLAYTLWPDASEKNARTNLRRHLYDLKRLLPTASAASPWVTCDRRTVQWNPEAEYCLDVAEFEQLRRSEATLGEAAALYNDNLLVGLDEEWLFYERERLRDSYLLLLSQLIAQYRAQNAHAKALMYARELLRHDPFREDALRQLMTTVYESGNRACALAEYERFAQHLRDELDVAPMPETQALYQQIASNRLPHLARPKTVKVARPQKPVRQIGLDFVGYEAELDRLRAMWHQAVQLHGQVLLLGGEAGVGKTRLVNEFRGLVAAEDVFVLCGTTTFAEPLPYQAVIEALQPMLPLLLTLDIPELWLAVLLPVLPQLQVLLPDLAAPAALDVDQEQVRLFDAIVYCLTRLASEQPLLLILEDLHWAGQGTLAILEFLARHVNRHAILVIATYREEELPRMHPLCRLRQRLRRDQLAKHLTLNGISYNAVTEIAQSVAARGYVVETLAQHLYSCSEGNPLFIQELINDWLGTGRLKLKKGQWHLDSQDDLRVPRNLRELLQSRLVRLTADTLALAEIVAVVGMAFDVELIRAISGWNETMVLNGLDELMDQHLIRETGGVKHFDYCFTHQLIQAVILDAIPASMRRSRHRRAAQVMEELYADYDSLAGTLALHFEQGGLVAKAADYTLLAAKHALSLYADEEALAWVSRGLRLTLDARIQWDLLMIREAIYHRRGERVEQRAALERLVQLADDLDDPGRVCHLLERQIVFYETLDERENALRYLTKLTEQVSVLDERSWKAKVLQLRATHLIYLGLYEESVPLLDEALAHYRTLGDQSGQARCYHLLAEMAVYQGRLDCVLPYVEQVRTLAETQTNHVLLAKAIHAAAAAAFVAQVFEHSKALALEALTLCQQIGYREGEANSHKLLGSILSRLFKVEESRHHYTLAAESYAALGKTQGLAAVTLNLGILNSRLGHLQEGITAFEKARELFSQIQDMRGLMLSELNLGATALLNKDYELTRNATSRGLALAKESNSVHIEAVALSTLGEMERELGHFDTAVVYMEQGVALRRSLDSQLSDLGHDLRELTITYLRKHDLENAKKTADELIALVEKDESSMLYPQQMLWAAAQTYWLLKESVKAMALLNAAYELLQSRAAAIPDTVSRQVFMQKWFNHQIVVAYQGDGWAI